MRLTYLLSAVLCVLMIAVSCKKSSHPSGDSTSLQGNWNFIDMVAQTNVTLSAGGASSVTYAKYKTANNGGTIDFTKDSMEINQLTYSIDTTAVTYNYIGTTLIDSTLTPVSQSVPPTSEALAYTVVGTDSISFPNGGFLPTGVPGGAGGHYVIANDTLKFTFSGTQAVTGGTETASGTFYLKRQ